MSNKSHQALKLNIQTLLNILCVIFLCACSSKVSQSNGAAELLKFDGLEIGKNQTALIGRVSLVDTTQVPLQFTMTVEKTEQGGAGAPVFVPKTNIDLIASEMFIRSFNANHSKPIREILLPNQRLLVIVNQSLVNQNITITHLQYE